MSELVYPKQRPPVICPARALRAMASYVRYAAHVRWLSSVKPRSASINLSVAYRC